MKRPPGKRAGFRQSEQGVESVYGLASPISKLVKRFTIPALISIEAWYVTQSQYQRPLLLFDEEVSVQIPCSFAKNLKSIISPNSRLAPNCIALHTARIGGGATQWVDTACGSETAFRPIGANFNLVTTPA